MVRGETVQVDSSFWIESDYYALLVKEFTAITKELFKHLDMEYSYTVKMKLMKYFRNYFSDWNYSSFSSFVSWCEKLSSGTIPLRPPSFPKWKDRIYKDDLEYYKQKFVYFLEGLETIYDKLNA